MSEPSNPELPNAGDTQVRKAQVDQLISELKLLVPPWKKTLVLLERESLWKWIVLGVFVVAFAVLIGSSWFLAGRVADVTAQLSESTRLLESLRTESDKTQRKVEGVSTQVQAVADEQPSVVLVDAGAGKPAKPSIVVKPKSPPAPGPKAPPVSVPLELPKAKIADDAGSP